MLGAPSSWQSGRPRGESVTGESVSSGARGRPCLEGSWRGNAGVKKGLDTCHVLLVGIRIDSVLSHFKIGARFELDPKIRRCISQISFF